MTSARAARLAIALVGLALMVSACTDTSAENPVATPATAAQLYSVLSVADGDTITVDLAGSRERVRLLGIDAPEVTGTTECFGNEATQYAKGILTGTSVGLIRDPTQDDRDRFGRLLRYVILPDGTDFDAQLLALGYANEYTYDKPYQRQSAYRAAESAANSADRGLWSPETCSAATALSDPTDSPAAPANPGASAAATTAAATTGALPGTTAGDCAIKGNISSKGEKIYHQPGDSSYPETVITESKGERYFCSVADAVAAGWRPAKN